MMRPVRQAGSGGVTNRGAYANIARTEMLRPGERLRDEAAVFDQGWAASARHTLQRRVDLLNRLAGDHEIIARHLAREVIDSVFEREGVGRAVDQDAERLQLNVGLLRHVGLSKAGYDLEAVSSRIEVAGE